MSEQFHSVPSLYPMSAADVRAVGATAPRVTLYCTNQRKGDAQYRLSYRINVGGIRCSFHTDYCLSAGEWNVRAGLIVIPTGVSEQRRSELLLIQSRCRWEMRALQGMAQRRVSQGAFCANELLGEFRAFVVGQSFLGIMRRRIDFYAASGSVRTSETYRSALASFCRFRQGADIMLYELSPDVVADYQRYLLSKGLMLGSVSFYMRILRAAFNCAVRHGFAEGKNPFSTAYTGIPPTAKRAISAEAVGRIRRLDLSCSASFTFARDMFMLSFYLRGMSFVDMAYLRKSDLSGGYLTYTRRKTGQTLTIRWEQPMQAIVARYASSTQYLLPIITDESDASRQYMRAAKRICRQLKQIGRMAGVPAPLTMYVARHSWASIAKQKRVPISVISDALGHDSETTTRIYLATLDTTPIDDANLRVISSI